MKKVIILLVVVAIVGVGVYLWKSGKLGAPSTSGTDTTTPPAAEEGTEAAPEAAN